MTRHYTGLHIIDWCKNRTLIVAFPLWFSQMWVKGSRNWRQALNLVHRQCLTTSCQDQIYDPALQWVWFNRDWKRFKSTLTQKVGMSFVVDLRKLDSFLWQIVGQLVIPYTNTTDCKDSSSQTGCYWHSAGERCFDLIDLLSNTKTNPAECYWGDLRGWNSAVSVQH